MKFAVFEFCEDHSCEVGSTSWIVNQDETAFNNEVWLSNTEVRVDWPLSPKDYSKWANKSGKSALDSSCETKTYVARVVKFNESYEATRKLLTTYLKTGNTQTPVRGRGKRESKKNDRYMDGSDDDDTAVKPPKKLKTKRNAISNSLMSEKYISKLKEKLSQKEKQSEDEHDSEESESLDESDKENCKVLRKQLVAKDHEIKALKKEMQKMKDLQDMQDMVQELKDSVLLMKKLASAPCRCKAKVDSIKLFEKPEKDHGQRKHPLSHVIPKEELGEASSESDIDTVKLCSGIGVTPGQLKILKSKHSAKEFVYALLPMVWSREVLATHSVSGRQSNAHKRREAKPQLDVGKVDSICNYVAQKFGLTPKEVKQFCASKINNIVKCSAKAEK